LEIGFIGLGRMGLAMARSLLAAGHELAVHDWVAADVDSLAALGARVGSRIAEVCNADAIITMLTSDEEIETAVFGRAGVLEAMPTGAAHLAMSGISAELVRRLALAHRRAGQAFVVPVLGSPEAAAEGKLFILAAGGSAAVARCRPLFAAVAQRSFLLGA
jgi:3-hydroxyisobutyrate dehydrogenase-like beta-hydroxyacid dehydrogenase